MALEEQLKLQKEVTQIAERYAAVLSRYMRRGATNTLTARTGRTFRSFKPKVRTDRQTGWPYAFGVSARYTAFIQDAGQGPNTKSGGTVSQHSRQGHTVHRYARTIRAKNFMGPAIRNITPRVTRDIAKAGAEGAAKITIQAFKP